ncbi:B3 domain-containing transcription repressor VAL2-like [Silene latifolia]|uniref:B3 domain-containing transcription repressor VAL2-like n=1 Tax=Silene latifolia TaxID=37657 RepID=UPI003D76AAE0
MGMKTCMNILCGTTSSAEWKTGWSLRSGELANLCDKCGYAFEQRMYCEEFHSDDSGWRNCFTCGKRLHCGCIASLSLIELLDGGGVKCIGCARNSASNSRWNGGRCDKYELCTMTENIESIGNHKGSHGGNQLSISHNLNTNTTLGMLKQEGLIFPPSEAVVTAQPLPSNKDTPSITGPWGGGATWASTLAQTSMGSFLNDRLDVSSNKMQNRDDYESVAHPNLNICLGGPSGNLQFTSGTIIDEKREPKKMSNAFNQGFISPNIVSSPSKLPYSPAPDTSVSMMPPLRVAKPPFEGRGRHQLLPRYWPRITEQELQQISGDSNCTILPLFEKVLSASDAGRIGRLVLPKACAEAYFPPISQPEGLPIKIQDVKGKEWVFQFRFWPNNNSRMYVLEGVTPCIQSLQLQAGDTVTFSRKDPEGKLVMGFRKASNPSIQDLPVANGVSGLPQSMKAPTDTHLNILSRQSDSAGGNVYMHNSENCGEPSEEGLLPSPMTTAEKKKGRNIGAKSKRLLIDNQDVQALRLTWEEVQGMLRPPQNVKPSIVVVDDFEFEEYEEPPVFGKPSVFAAHSSGVIDQWAQCDSCSKWRRLPADFLLPPKWTCADNAWDPTRCFCSAPDELSPRELENFSNHGKDFKKKKATMANRVIQEQESSGLSALANAAVLGDNPNQPGTSAVATTTKHPRHRPGCSCIVCIQPPSGKGKHKSTCTCTVCMTVKRRFKTLMMRKKKRQTDQEAEMVLKSHQKLNFSGEDDKLSNENQKLHPEIDSLQTELAQTGDEGQDLTSGLGDSGSGLDLNFRPDREQDSKMGNGQASFTNVLQLAGVPLDTYMKENGLNCLTPKEQASSEAQPEQVGGVIEGEDPVSQASAEQAKPSDGSCESENANKQQDDPQ